MKNKKFIIIGAAVAVVLGIILALTIPALIKGKDGNDNLSDVGSSAGASVNIEDIEDRSDDEDEEYLEPDETEADKILEEYKNKTESQASETSSAATTPTTSTSTTQNTNNSTGNSSTGSSGTQTGGVTINGSGTFNGKTFVQAADPETGISWDGVSPIIYTYPDGTTGTEKREGASYEKYPNMFTTIVTVPTGGENITLAVLVAKNRVATELTVLV